MSVKCIFRLRAPVRQFMVQENAHPKHRSPNFVISLRYLIIRSSRAQALQKRQKRRTDAEISSCLSTSNASLERLGRDSIDRTPHSNGSCVIRSISRQPFATSTQTPDEGEAAGAAAPNHSRNGRSCAKRHSLLLHPFRALRKPGTEAIPNPRSRA